MRNSKANPAKAKVNPTGSRKRINNAKAEARRVRNSKANPAKAKAGVLAIRKARKQPKAVMASLIGARTAIATPVAAAAAPICSETWTTLISTAH